jgi:hypothetical protein
MPTPKKQQILPLRCAPVGITNHVNNFFRKFLREYIGATPQFSSGREVDFTGADTHAKTIIQSVYKMPVSSDIKTRH